MSRAKYLLPISLILLVIVATISLAKDPNPPKQPTTVGEFALKVLRAADDDSAKSITAEKAVEILRRAGLKLKGSVNDPLTDGDKSSYALAVAGGLFDRLTPPPEGFEQCQGMDKVPDCLKCCTGLSGASMNICGKACGRDHANQQHASGSEPLP
jgi:hypothetical protein